MDKAQRHPERRHPSSIANFPAPLCCRPSGDFYDQVLAGENARPDCDTLLVSEDGANRLARSTPIAFPASGKYWVNNHAHILKFDDMVTQRFVEHFLESIPLDEYITGAAQPKLNQRALNSIPIPVPALAEQQRIVGILDEAFEGIATPKPTPKRTSKTPAPSSKATSNPSSPNTARGGATTNLMRSPNRTRQ